MPFPSTTEPSRTPGDARNRLAVVGAAMLLALVALAVLAPFARLAAFNHPYADDPCLALLERQGLMRGQIDFYRQWTGRYASTFTTVVYPWLFGLVEGAPGVPWVMLVVLFSGFFALVRWLGPQPGSLGAAAAAVSALVAVAVYVTTMPKTSSGLYWMTAAFTNVLGIALVPIWLRLAWPASPPADTVRRLARSAGACLLAVFIVGCSETTMVTFLVVVASATPALWRLGRGHAVANLTAAFVASAAVVLAPGNRVRMAQMRGRGELLETLLQAAGDAGASMAGWLASPIILVALLATVAAVFALAWRPRIDGRWIGAVTVAVVSAGFVPVHWSTGGPPGARTQNTLYLAFLFGLLTAAACLASRIAPARRLRRPAGAIVLLLAVPLLAYALWTSPASRGARRDLASRGPAFHRAMQARYAAIEDAMARGEKTLVVPAIPKAERPWTIYLGDITARPRHWSNGCYARWFGLESIVLAPEQRRPGKRGRATSPPPPPKPPRRGESR